MTTETPCLSACRASVPADDILSEYAVIFHAPGCPSAKPAETPCVAGCINAEFHDEYHRPNAPKPAEPETCRHCKQSRRCCGGVCCNCKRELPPYFGPQYKPAEPPACKCRHEKSAHCTECSAGCGCDSYEPQGSEPPMGRIEASERAMHANDRRMLDAYRAENAALKAERDALKADLNYLKDGIPLTYNPNTMCRDGHKMVLFTSDFEPCPMCALKARLCEREAESQAVMAALLGERVHHSQRTLEPVIYATALKVLVERYEDLIVEAHRRFTTTENDSDTAEFVVYDICKEARAIRARKEQEASNAR